MIGLLAVAAAMEPASGAGNAAPNCSGAPGIAVVCGIPVPEDIAPVPGTPWLIATSMPRGGEAGGLYLIDTRTLKARKADLGLEQTGKPARFAAGAAEAAAVATCAPLDPTRFISHGISLSPGKGGIHRLYVVGHGGREAIELFNVDARKSVPTLQWAGCVTMPQAVEGNSVVGLPGGGLMFTTLYDPGETAWPARIRKLATGAPTGAVFEWHPASGIVRLPVPPISGPNGIAVSADGKSIFLAGWGDRILRRVDRKGRETAAPVTLDFLPDNLHWGPGGMLFAAGQATTVQSMFACSAAPTSPGYCVPEWSVAKINPGVMRVTARMGGKTGGVFGDTTSAVLHRGWMWLGSINGDRIGVVAATEK